jgi:purine-binding chemotaxis protein CheW
MDLAKIRQKARQEQDNRRLEASLPASEEHADTVMLRNAPSLQQIPDVDDYFQDVQPAIGQIASQDTPTVQSPSLRIVPRDPLEAILAGRESAGCGENLLLASSLQSDTIEDTHRKFLCFKVSDEIYGVDIMDIKELIKPREVTEVPRAPSFVAGVISLRGVIIPIIDLLERLGLARSAVTGRERVIVVRHGESFSGLLVDEIIQVALIAGDDIEAAPTVLDGIDRDFVTGIGRADNRMVILLNLANIVDIHLY